MCLCTVLVVVVSGLTGVIKETIALLYCGNYVVLCYILPPLEDLTLLELVFTVWKGREL